jgi:hypothetical protein
MRQQPLAAFTIVNQNQSCLFKAALTVTECFFSLLSAFAAMMWHRFNLPPGISGA